MRRVPFLLTILFAIASSNVQADLFRLQEQLGRNWSNEFVMFSTFHAPDQSWKLVDQAGQSVPFQWMSTPASKQHRIGFQVDLKPYQQSVYRLIRHDGADQHKTDLSVRRDGDQLRIFNSKVGISLRTKAPSSGQGPIAGIMLRSGKWVGDSRLLIDQTVAAWKVSITAKGPVYAEAIVQIKSAGGGDWTTRVRVYADEPVVLLDEKSAGSQWGTLQLQLDRNFDPQSLFYRYGKSTAGGRVGTNATAPIKSGVVFQLEPWLRWWEAERRGPSFSLYNAAEQDLLSVSARNAGVWVDPLTPVARRTPPLIALVKDETGLHADFPIAQGARSWMIGCHDRDQSLSVMNDQTTKTNSPIPYQYLIKHGHFPLDTIKEYQLSWESNVARPQMLIGRDDVKRFRDRIDDPLPLRKKAKYFVDNPPTLTVSSLDDAVAAYLATDDTKLGTRLARMSEDLIDQWIASLLDQNGMPFGAAPHEKSTIAAAIALADLLVDTTFFSDDERIRVRHKLAFLGYTFARPEYWSVQRGYSANPNMTTTVYGYRVSIACFLSDHPMAKAWAHESLGELQNRLQQWSDEHGGWLEAPHYAVVSYDQILGAFVMAHHAGFSDALFEQPQVKSVARWLAAINTPPDSRIGGYRHHPAIGHTYVNEPCGDFGLLAYLFRQRDPSFAAHMQWQFQQNNRYSAAGIGGFFPAFAGFRKVLSDPHLAATEPNYQSQLFPKTGVVLRDQHPSARETYLHMILGQHREHYDDDSGSIVLYGKGRVLVDEFGYRGNMPAADHSMIESAGVPSGFVRPGLFVTSRRFDYIEAEKQAWKRQIVMVKGASSEEPAYFVINDTVESNRPMSWRIWLTADDVSIASKNSARVDGKEDVDMDVVFFTPNQLQLSVEEKTRLASSGLYPNWNWRAMETTQLGLIATSTADSGGHRLRAVLFPRLKSTKPPQVTPIAEGKGIRVDHSDGTDYVFISAKQVQHRGDDVSFQGRAGMIQLRDGQTILKIAGPGKISAGEKTLIQGAK